MTQTPADLGTLLTGSNGTPTFFIGLLLVQWFALDLHRFPAFAPQSPTIRGILSDPVALILPVATYAFVAFAVWSAVH